MKRTRNDTFNSCVIDAQRNVIIEFNKDGEKVEFPIQDIIDEWGGIENLSITIKQTQVID